MSLAWWLAHPDRRLTVGTISPVFAQRRRVNGASIEVFRNEERLIKLEARLEEGVFVFTPPDSFLEIGKEDLIRLTVSYVQQPPVLSRIYLDGRSFADQSPLSITFYPAPLEDPFDSDRFLKSLCPRERALLALATVSGPVPAPALLAGQQLSFLEVQRLRREAIVDERSLQDFFCALEATTHWPPIGPWAETITCASETLGQRLDSRSLCFGTGNVPVFSHSVKQSAALAEASTLVQGLIKGDLVRLPSDGSAPEEILFGWALECFAAGDLAVRHKTLIAALDDQGIADSSFFFMFTELALASAAKGMHDSSAWHQQLPGLIRNAHIFIEVCVQKGMMLPAPKSVYETFPRLPYSNARRLELRKQYDDWWNAVAPDGTPLDQQLLLLEDAFTDLVSQNVQPPTGSTLTDPTRLRQLATPLPPIVPGGA